MNPHHYTAESFNISFMRRESLGTRLQDRVARGGFDPPYIMHAIRNVEASQMKRDLTSRAHFSVILG